MVTTWLHILALSVFLGAVIGMSFIFLPALSAVSAHDQRLHLLARGLKFYNPLQVGALGLVLFTGAFQLTELKAAYREMFVQQLGYALALKLSLAFFLVIFSVYQSMGIGHRFVRRQETGDPLTPAEVHSTIRRLKIAGACILALAIFTLCFGLRLRA
jgi:uncharacterized membrane protein